MNPCHCRACKKKKVLAAIQINGCGNSHEDSALKSPMQSARNHPPPASAPYITPLIPTLLDSKSSQQILGSLGAQVIQFHFLISSHRCSHA